MATPKDNTEVIQMLRDVKNSIWKSLTPMRAAGHNYNDYITNLTNTVGGSSRINPPNIATKLNFSSIDETQSYSDSTMFRSFETPESLKRKLMTTEVELQATKAKIKERDSLISVMEPANKKMRVSLENQLEKYRKQNEMDSQTIEELQGKLKWAKKQVSSARSQINDTERQKKIEIDKQEMKFLAMQGECSNLKDEMAGLKSEKSEAIRKMNMEIGRLELKITNLNEAADKAEDYITSLKKQNGEMAEKVALCNSYQSELKELQSRTKIMENKIEADKDAALIVASRQNDLKSLTELQKENRTLREEVSKYKESNVMLYQEKMWSMQEKLTQAEKKSVFLAKLQVENEQLKSKISQWEDLFDDKSTPYKTPTAFSRKLSQYQQNEAVLTNNLSQLSAHCKTLEKQVQEKDEKNKTINDRLELSQVNLSRQESFIKRLQRKVVFLSKEKDHSRKMLDSYLSEATISGIALNAAQVSHLEDMNAEYKRALEKCETEIENLNEKLKIWTEGHKEDGESTLEAQKLRDNNEALLSQITELRKEITDLQNKSSQQSNSAVENSEPYRVLHLRFNPLEAASRRHRETYARLQEENDQLKKRIKVLEEEGLAAQDVTMKVQQKLKSEGADSTLQALKDQLTSSERKLRFVLENAKIKSTEFREAVYRLTGFRIDVPMSETYKLSHVYADSREDYLLFKINSDGVQLIETEYSKQIHERMELYLHQHDSFPAFLASLTMDLFNQQTFMIDP